MQHDDEQTHLHADAREVLATYTAEIAAAVVETTLDAVVSTCRGMAARITERAEAGTESAAAALLAFADTIAEEAAGLAASVSAGLATLGSRT